MFVCECVYSCFVLYDFGLLIAARFPRLSPQPTPSCPLPIPSPSSSLDSFPGDVMLEGRAWEEVSPEGKELWLFFIRAACCDTSLSTDHRTHTPSLWPGKELLLSLLSQDPTQRPTATEVLHAITTKITPIHHFIPSAPR